MPFNYTDPTQPPWVGGIMTLTHEECVDVKEACQIIIDGFSPTVDTPQVTTQYVVSKYNAIDWKKSINGETYEELQRYDVETMTEGIPLVKVPTEEPQPEQPTEG
jgi:hypothetical protein